MAVECAECGVRSELEASFAAVRGSFSRRVRHVCPRCQYAGALREESGIPHWTLGMLAGATALVLGWPHWTAGWVAFHCAWFSLFAFVSVPFHEAGHVIAARATGMWLFGVTLGSGRLRRHSTVLGVPVEWRSIPAGGVTRAAPVRAQGARWRLVLLALAGPAVNLALAAAAWPWLPDLGSSDAWRSPLGGVTVGWTAANAFAAAASLVPYRISGSMGPLASDGLLAWRALRADPETVREWLAARYELQAERARQDERLDPAIAAVREGLLAFPGHSRLSSLLGVLLVDAGRGDEGRSVFLAQLEDELPEIERAVALSNVAWCGFLSGRDELLEEADQCSEEAMRFLAWLPPVQNTRGAVLAWSGRAAEALPLLAGALAGAERPADRAAVACVQALAHRQLGQPDEAKQALEHARTLDPTCPLLHRNQGDGN